MAVPKIVFPKAHHTLPPAILKFSEVVRDPLPILVVSGDSHEILFREFFLPGFPGNCRLQKKARKDSGSTGAILTEGWQEAVTEKVRAALEHCRHSPEDALFLVSDVDVQFFPAFDAGGLVEIFERLGCDIAFQKERTSPADIEVNTGFYLAKNTHGVRELLETSLGILEKKSLKNDQNVINEVLTRGGTSHACLDERFYCRSQGFPPPKNIWIHHANWSETVADKIRQLRRVRRYLAAAGPGSHWEVFQEYLGCVRKSDNSMGGLLYAVKSFVSKLPLRPLTFP